MTFSMLIFYQGNCYYSESHFTAMRCYALSLTNDIAVYIALRAKRPSMITAGQVAKCVCLLTPWRWCTATQGVSKVWWHRDTKSNSLHSRCPNNIEIRLFGISELHTKIKYDVTYLIRWNWVSPTATAIWLVVVLLGHRVNKTGCVDITRGTNKHVCTNSCMTGRCLLSHVMDSHNTYEILHYCIMSYAWCSTLSSASALTF